MPITQKDLSLNEFLQPNDSPLTGRAKVRAVDYERQYEPQSRFMRMSNVNIKDFVQHSNIVITSFSLGNGSQSEFTTTLTPQIPHQNDPNFAIGYISLYQQSGTSTLFGSAQIFPRVGNGVAIGAYTVQCFADYHRYDGTSSVISGAITNNSGSTQNIVFVSYWSWIQYNFGSNP